MLIVLPSNDDDVELSVLAAATRKSRSSDPVMCSTKFLLDKAQTELDDTRRESDAAQTFAMIGHSLEKQLAQDNKALERARTDKAESTTALEAENADLADDESLAAVVASQVACRKQLCLDGEASVSLWLWHPHSAHSARLGARGRSPR